MTLRDILGITNKNKAIVKYIDIEQTWEVDFDDLIDLIINDLKDIVKKSKY